MENKEYTRAEGLIQNLTTARSNLLAISSTGNDIPEDHDSQANVLIIKITCFNAINELLRFCTNELEVKKNTTVDQIRKKLRSNFNIYYPSQISFEKIKSLDSVIDDLTTYIKQQSSYTAVSFTDEDSYLVRNFVAPKPDNLNIAFVNKKIEPLKKILPMLDSTITPTNTSFFLKHDLYKNLDAFTLTRAIDELNILLKMWFFDVTVEANASWMRSINFLNQLRNIMREVYRKFWDIPVVQKPSLDKESDVPSDNVLPQEKKIADVPSVEKPSPTISSINDAPLDILPKKREKYGRHMPIVVDHSLMPKKDKTIEQCFKEADQDFAVGGPKFLLRAKERYLYILKAFPGSWQEEYILSQIAIIDKQIDVIMTPPTAPSYDAADTTLKKTPSQGKIDSKTWTIEDDFFRI